MSAKSAQNARVKAPRTVSSLAAAREQRLSYGRLPKPGSGAVPYANCREELAGLSLGEKVTSPRRPTRGRA